MQLGCYYWNESASRDPQSKREPILSGQRTNKYKHQVKESLHNLWWGRKEKLKPGAETRKWDLLEVVEPSKRKIMLPFYSHSLFSVSWTCLWEDG